MTDRRADGHSPSGTPSNKDARTHLKIGEKKSNRKVNWRWLTLELILRLSLCRLCRLSRAWMPTLFERPSGRRPRSPRPAPPMPKSGRAAWSQSKPRQGAQHLCPEASSALSSPRHHLQTPRSKESGQGRGGGERREVETRRKLEKEELKKYGKNQDWLGFLLFVWKRKEDSSNTFWTVNVK